MDLKAWAEQLDGLEMDPYFTLGHVLVTTMNARADMGANCLYFSRKHPLACWLSTLLSVFSSPILANFLLNEPVISVLANTRQVPWASAIWYAVFYSPFDLCHRLASFGPARVLLQLLDELYTCRSIRQGVLHASKVFPHSYAIIGLIGVVRGNGPAFMRALERLIRGSWSLGLLEFTHPSRATKISLLVTTMFLANRHLEWLMIAQPFVLFCALVVASYLRLLSHLFLDPFGPLERLAGLLLFGGVWDALARALGSAASGPPRPPPTQLHPATQSAVQVAASSAARGRPMKVDPLVASSGRQVAASGGHLQRAAHQRQQEVTQSPVTASLVTGGAQVGLANSSSRS